MSLDTRSKNVIRIVALLVGLALLSSYGVRLGSSAPASARAGRPHPA